MFDEMTTDDLILAFFPCVYFSVQKTTEFMLVKNGTQKWTLADKAVYAIRQAEKRLKFHVILYKLVAIADTRKLRLVIENPYHQAGFLCHNFLKPTIIDKNRMKRGDYFVKPTAYWFFNCEPTHGFSYQNDKVMKTITKCKPCSKAGMCSEERSMISPDYARNWICDFILGKDQHLEKSLFDEVSA